MSVLGATQDAMSGRATPAVIEYKLLDLQPKGADGQTQEKPEEKTWLALLLEILGAILSMPAEAAKQSVEETK